MTNKNITKVPALGQAWSGDWQARIRDRLRARGFSSITAFSESEPRASIVELAEELSTDHEAEINRADVAAEQLLRIWHEEARQAGPEAIERLSRRLLVGALHSAVPEGWHADWKSEEARSAASRAAAALTHWRGHLGKEHRPAADRIVSALLREGREGTIPPGWLPTSADDPRLVDLFRRHWVAP